MHADVGAQAGHVGATVVETEPEPATQLREPRLAAERRIQVNHPVANVWPPVDPAGQGRRDDIADPLMRGRRQQPDGCNRVGGRGDVGDAAQLEVAPGGQFQRARAQLCRDARQRRQLRSGDHAARQPDPHQRAVGGLVHLQRARTGVAIAGSVHALPYGHPGGLGQNMPKTTTHCSYVLMMAGGQGGGPGGGPSPSQMLCATLPCPE